jgi:hypothetical protein
MRVHVGAFQVVNQKHAVVEQVKKAALMSCLYWYKCRLKMKSWKDFWALEYSYRLQ